MLVFIVNLRHFLLVLEKLVGVYFLFNFIRFCGIVYDGKEKVRSIIYYFYF